MSVERSSSRWLFGPVPDLLIGCGVAYSAIFVLLCVAGPELRRLVPFGLAPLLLLVSGTPHYGATLLRVYEKREDRRGYLFFSVFATLAVALWFVAGVYLPLAGSLLLTVMLTWSPWHYTGQNYGIALMFLRRRGVPVSVPDKRLLYASFFLSYLLTFLAVHGGGSAAEYAPTAYEAVAIRFLPLGIPEWLRGPSMLGVGVAYLASLSAVGVRMLRVAPLRDLAPAVVILFTQALWFSVPVLARQVGVLQGLEPLSVQHAAYAFLWVAAGHSLQYLWVTWYYARQSDPSLAGAAYAAKTVLAGAALWTLPALLFAPGRLGAVPFDAGLAVLISAAVNVHHFILDGAIWKLRDGRIARILLRQREEAGAAPLRPPRRGGLSFASLAWAAGAVSVVVIVASTLEEEYGFRRSLQSADLARAELAHERLRWMGRDSAAGLSSLAMLTAREGPVEPALRLAEQSLELYETADGWQALGSVQVRAGRPERAIQPYRKALRLDPARFELANNLAWIRATHPAFQYRDSEEAVRLARQVVEATGGRNAAALDTLGAAYASASRFADARRAADAAYALAEQAGDEELAREIAARSAGYAEGRPYRQDPAAGRNLPLPEIRLRSQFGSTVPPSADGGL